MLRLGPATLFLVLATATFSSPASQAQAQSIGRIELVAQTVWVGADPAVIDLRVTSEVEDRRLEVRIYPPITDPSRLRDAFSDHRSLPEPSDDGFVGLFSVENLDERAVGVGDVVSIALPDEEIGEGVRKLPGALPVVIDLTENGAVVDTIVTALLVADEEVDPVDIHLAFISDLRSPLAHAVDQSISIDTETMAEELAQFADRLPPAATVALTPETLSAGAADEDADGLAIIDTIAETLTHHSLFATGWVDLDEEAWRLANEERLVLDSYTLGQMVLEEYLGRSASSISLLDPDATAETIGLLRTAGVAGVIVGSEQLPSVDIRRADGRPLQILDDNGVGMPVLAIAEELHDDLESTDVELAAHQILSELILVSTSASSPRGYVIDLDTVSFPALDALLTKIAVAPAITTASVEEVLSLPLARSPSGTIIRTELVSAEAPSLGGDATDLRLTEAVVDSYESMVAPAQAPIAPLRTLLLAATASELDSDSRRAYTNEVFNTVSDGISGFEILESSRITLASRTAELPIAIHNNQPLPITVILRIGSEKLRFPDGNELTLSLVPGLNEFELRVETVASGDARLTATLTSPDGRLDLATGTIDIRSTAISGLGLVISVVALLVLGAWWARTILRVRRERHAASVAASETDSA